MGRRAPLICLFFVSCLLAAVTGCGKTDRGQGEALYLQYCASCHFDHGRGLRQLYPPLAGADYLGEHPDRVVRGIRYGMNGPMEIKGVVYNYPMPGNSELTEFQIVNIVNYINQAWGNDYGTITVAQAREWLAE